MGREGNILAGLGLITSSGWRMSALTLVASKAHPMALLDWRSMGESSALASPSRWVCPLVDAPPRENNTFTSTFDRARQCRGALDF